MSPSPEQRRFTLVLSGGGSRGFAHVGVLAALEHYGWRPSALVGVSMGALVAAVYALRDDWRASLEAMDTSGFPRPVVALSRPRRRGVGASARRWWSSLQAGRDLFFDWGIGRRSLTAGRAVLEELTGGRDLRQAWLPLAVCATDLRSGRRVVLRSGDAADAVFASAALAGVLPPVRWGNWLLADGVYADMAPIDIARELGNPVVIAVDPGQEQRAEEIHNGFQALMRAVEICHLNHAHLRFELADLVLRPVFRRTIDTLDFGARRECVAAGVRAVRAARGSLRRLLGDAPPPGPRVFTSQEADHGHPDRALAVPDGRPALPRDAPLRARAPRAPGAALPSGTRARRRIHRSSTTHDDLERRSVMLSVKNLSISVALWAAITYTLCVIYGLLVPPQFHASELFEAVLPGFHWISIGSFVIGLVETFVYGAYTGLVFGVVYNAVQRRSAVA